MCNPMDGSAMRAATDRPAGVPSSNSSRAEASSTIISIPVQPGLHRLEDGAGGAQAGHATVQVSPAAWDDPGLCGSRVTQSPTWRVLPLQLWPSVDDGDQKGHCESEPLFWWTCNDDSFIVFSCQPNRQHTTVIQYRATAAASSSGKRFVCVTEKSREERTSRLKDMQVQRTAPVPSA